MKRLTTMLAVVALCAFASVTFAQSVLPPGAKGGPPNAWGTPDNFLAFKATLDKYAASLVPMPCADLQKAYADLATKAAAAPALGDTTKQAGAEHSMYVSATRTEMDKPTKCGTGRPPGPGQGPSQPAPTKR